MNDDQVKAQERAIALLKQLNNVEAFNYWRDDIAKPLLGQWENQLANADQLPEVELRATLKHYFTLKNLFYDWFKGLE